MSTLDERVSELEAQLATLQARSVPPGYSALSGMTVDALGNVSYDFDGHVHAQGLDLDAGDQLVPPDDDRVRWIRTSDRAVVADIAAFSRDAGGIQQGAIQITAYGQPERDDAVVQLLAIGGPDPDDNTTIAVTASGRIELQARTAQATLLDNAGNSSYLRGLRGISTITMTTPNSGSVTVPHGLDVVPVVLCSVVAGGSLLFDSYAQVSAYDDTSFELSGIVTAAGDFTGGTLDVSWIALY